MRWNAFKIGINNDNKSRKWAKKNPLQNYISKFILRKKKEKKMTSQKLLFLLMTITN